MAKTCDNLKDNRRLCFRQKENKGVFSPPKTLCWGQWSLFSSWRLFEVYLYVYTVPNHVLELKLASENIHATLTSWGCPSCNRGWCKMYMLHGLPCIDSWTKRTHGFPEGSKVSVGILLIDFDLGDFFSLHWKFKVGKFLSNKGESSKPNPEDFLPVNYPVIHKPPPQINVKVCHTILNMSNGSWKQEPTERRLWHQPPDTESKDWKGSFWSP